MRHKDETIYSKILHGVRFVMGGQGNEAAGAESATAVVLAMFGTSVESAVGGLWNIKGLVAREFPQLQVTMAFTANKIRKVWQARGNDNDYRQRFPELPEELYAVQGVLATVANLQDRGVRNIIVQAVHMAPGEEYADLARCVEALASIRTVRGEGKPFQRLLLGRPAFGGLGEQDFPLKSDQEAVAKALGEDVRLAASHGAALLYMGHGSDFWPSAGYYPELAHRMRLHHPQSLTFAGSMKNYPGIGELVQELQRRAIRKVVLKPLMIVAGRHAVQDMIGPDPTSWKSVLESHGITCIPVLRGLGEQDVFGAIFVSHIRETAEKGGIVL